MKGKIIAVIVACGVLAAGFLHANTSERNGMRRDISLSPGVTQLLRAEMGQIAAGVQRIALSLATADWASVEEISAKIEASYLMKQKLTATQAQELQRALPSDFKRLDAEFHQRAGKLRMAAAARDPELATFRYSRMLESCAQCHSGYAKTRFPGFSSPVTHQHSH